MRRCVIVESPYRGDGKAKTIRSNVLYARRCVRDSIDRGEAPFAPHLFYTQRSVLDDAVEYERTIGIECGLDWAKLSAYSVFYTDRGWSPGMLAALHNFNLKRNRPFKIRALDGAPSLPATIDEDLEKLLRAYIER